jgi:hypothetical protein
VAESASGAAVAAVTVAPEDVRGSGSSSVAVAVWLWQCGGVAVVFK